MASHRRPVQAPVGRRPRRDAGPGSASTEPRGAGGDARDVASRVLHRVTDKGAFAMPALDGELARADLAPRDAALATEIVYGALRVLPALDAVVTPHLRRPLADMDPLTRAILRVGVYQLQHLGRVPARAAVHSSVELTRRLRSAQSAGFVNAVLRRVAEARPAEPAPPTQLVVPAWLRQVLGDSLDAARVDALLDQSQDIPPLCLAVADPSTREALAARLGAELGALSPHALLMRRAGDPRRLPGFEGGEFWVQEEGAQLVALAVGALAGERIVDACAGHGGKSLMLAAQLAGEGTLLSIDVDERKLARIPAQLSRLGLAGERAPDLSSSPFQQEAIDLSVGTGGLEAIHDRVLVDAPCSGLGTLRRRPELMLRLAPKDIARLAALQLEILERAVKLVRPGGRLTYAVCSPATAEGAAVADRFESRHGHLHRCHGDLGLFDIQTDSDGVLRLGPWCARGPSMPDAYQLVSWRVGA